MEISNSKDVSILEKRKIEEDKNLLVKDKGECGVQWQQQARIYVWCADKQDKHDRYWERLTKRTHRICSRDFTETKTYLHFGTS